MARLDKMSADERNHLLALPCPTYEKTPCTTGPELTKRRVAIISTAGLHRIDDRPFGIGAADYRIIPWDTPSNDLVMSHISTNFDRTGFQQDWNVVFPLDRLREFAEQKKIGSVAQYHYSLMGATDPRQMQEAAEKLAGIMKKDGVDAVFLVPV